MNFKIYNYVLSNVTKNKAWDRVLDYLTLNLLTAITENLDVARDILEVANNNKSNSSVKYSLVYHENLMMFSIHPSYTISFYVEARYTPVSLVTYDENLNVVDVSSQILYKLYKLTSELWLNITDSLPDSEIDPYEDYYDQEEDNS